MFDKKKLEALRAAFADAKAGETADSRFAAAAAAAAMVFGEGGRRKPPYSGVSTLLDAPYRPDAADMEDFAGLEIALIGVPMDLGVTNRPGARFGPRAVRDIERIGPYNHALDMVPLALCKAADIGDTPMRSRYSLDACIEDIFAFYARLKAANVRPLSVGGDHSVTYPILKALGAERPVGLVHFDAHCDTGGEFDGAKFHHGGPFRQAVLDGVLD
ncbi:MAG TPA: arginase family protein, partial [Caulobacteraceae bacterium]